MNVFKTRNGVIARRPKIALNDAVCKADTVFGGLPRDAKGRAISLVTIKMTLRRW